MDELLTYREVARILNVSIQTLKKYIDKNGLPCIKINKRKIMFKKDEFDKWLNDVYNVN